MEQQLLSSIRARPGDPAPRHVYADWLEERDDPRAELIRLNCELLEADTCHEEKATLARRRREHELAIQCDREWNRAVMIPRLVQSDEHSFGTEPSPLQANYRLFNPGGALSVQEDIHQDGTALYVNDVPAVLNFNDNEGSVGQWFVATGRGSSQVGDLEQIRKVAAGEFDDTKPAIDQIRPLIFCFRSCHLTVTRPVTGELNRFDKEEGWYYPYDQTTCIPTQPTASLNPDRIRYWREHLSDQPIVICLDAVWTTFILDGHHKLEAYRLERQPARFITIFVKPPADRGMDLSGFLTDRPVSRERYRRSQRYR